MRLPFISRAHHEDVVQRLEQQVTELKFERDHARMEHREAVNALILMGTGHRLEPAAEPATAVKEPSKLEIQNELCRDAADVREAVRKTGSRRPRAIARYITRLNQARQVERIKTDPQEAALKAMLEAENEGRSAAGATT